MILDIDKDISIQITVRRLVFKQPEYLLNASHTKTNKCEKTIFRKTVLLYMYDMMSYLHQVSVWWGLIASGKLAQLGKLHGSRHKERTPISSTFSSSLSLYFCHCLCLFFLDEIKASGFGFFKETDI